MDAVLFELFGRKQNIDLRRSEFLVGWGAAGKGELGGGGREGVEKDFAYPLKATRNFKKYDSLIGNQKMDRNKHLLINL